MTQSNNQDLPPLDTAKTNEEYIKLWNDAQQHVISFVKKNNLFSVPAHFRAEKPEELEPWWNSPEGVGEQDFFKKCRDLDCLSEVAHGVLGHNYYHARLALDDRPIRGAGRRYRTEMIDDEGMANGSEEILLLAGITDHNPRAKEITYIAQVFRAARMIADLKIHSNQWSVNDALEYYVKSMPAGWVSADTENSINDVDMGISHPGYAMSYVGGKIQLDKLLADRAHQLGNKFVMREFTDEFFKIGNIPISLARWEMTGFEDEIKKLW